jgi:transcriptional regulator with XRE-family HTH domain|nr:MAG TPA: hypothetical protein [Caudoviricetes sp.]
MKPNKKLVGKRIQAIRLERGLTLKQFGELIGASESSISEWENGKHLPPAKSIISRWENGISLPNLSRLGMIALIGNMTVNELLYGDNKQDIEELEQRLMEIPTKQRVELILRVLRKTKTEEENEEKKQKKIAAIKKITAI